MNSKILKSIISLLLAITISVLNISPVFAYSKEETVYGKINNVGENYKTTVSEHLKNTNENQTLKDLSELLGITNTGGDETFNQNGRSIEWNSQGNDIYYQGNTEKELPLGCSIKYELNGKKILPNDLLGKKGKVKICIEYTNKEEHIVNINGTNTKMYTPFVVVTGTVINNEIAKNITITNGKIIDNGQKTLLLGITCPGLKESLGINKSNLDLDIPENVEIEFETESFEMENIISYATPKILDNEDILNLDKLDGLYQDISTLSDSSKQIVKGADTLQDGTQSLMQGAKNLSTGVSTAYNGTVEIEAQVKDAIKSLKADDKDALDSSSVNEIGAQAANKAKLSDNEKNAIGNQAENAAKATITNQLSLIQEQAKTEAQKTIENQKSVIETTAKEGTKLTKAQQEQLENIMENYLSQNPVYSNLNEQEQKGLLQTILPTMITLVQNSVDTTAKEVSYQTAQTVGKNVASTGAKKIAEQIAGTVANATAQTVAESTAVEAAKKTATLTATQVANEVKKTAQNSVISQMGELQSGVSKLASGLSEIKTGTTTLVSGTENLNQGAQSLSSGIANFDEEGIQKIASLVNGDVKDLQTRIEKLKDLANNYNTFGGKEENTQGTVKFMFVIDSIKKDGNNEVIIPNTTLEGMKEEKK